VEMKNGYLSNRSEPSKTEARIGRVGLSVSEKSQVTGGGDVELGSHHL
jgi:hypothetical protein